MARLFGVEPARQAQLDVAAREAAIFRMKHFVVRRASKKYPEDKLPPEEPDGAARGRARAVRQLVSRARRRGRRGADDRRPCSTRSSRARRLGAVVPELDLFERWAAVHRFVPAAHAALHGWVSFHAPHFVDHDDLVPLRRPDPKLPNITDGPVEHRRRRDGFGLTDGRMSRREVASEADYCMYCHEREKDSCSKGMHDKQGAVKKNPLGVALRGCPLDEKIGEMHVLRQGRRLDRGAGGDRHRQPDAARHRPPHLQRLHEGLHLPEAGAGQHPAGRDRGPHRRARDALGIRDLRPAHPLEPAQPGAAGYPRPYIGKNVLVVGLGPAGSTLAQHLVNAGFGVVGIDGLKIEPLAR